MILSQSVVKPITGARLEAFSWFTPSVVDEDIDRARSSLEKKGYLNKMLSEGWPGDRYDTWALSHAFAAKRVMKLTGIQNTLVTFDSERSWTPVIEASKWDRPKLAGHEPATQQELQAIANDLAGTPDAERLFARFTGYTALHDDGAAYPCLTSRMIGTIETGVNGRVRLTEAAFGLPIAPLLVETRSLTLSPLSAEFRLGLPAAPLGSRFRD